jgi:hypothetical protein
MLELGTKMIKAGLMYADDTPVDVVGLGGPVGWGAVRD